MTQWGSVVLNQVGNQMFCVFENHLANLTTTHRTHNLLAQHVQKLPQHNHR